MRKITPAEARRVRQTTPLSLLIQGTSPLPEGLLQAMSQYLGQHGVFVEALDAHRGKGLRLLLDAPVAISLSALQAGLEAVAHRLNVGASLAEGWG